MDGDGLVRVRIRRHTPLTAEVILNFPVGTSTLWVIRVNPEPVAQRAWPLSNSRVHMHRIHNIIPFC